MYGKLDTKDIRTFCTNFPYFRDFNVISENPKIFPREKEREARLLQCKHDASGAAGAGAGVWTSV